EKNPPEQPRLSVLFVHKELNLGIKSNASTKLMSSANLKDLDDLLHLIDALFIGTFVITCKGYEFLLRLISSEYRNFGMGVVLGKDFGTSGSGIDIAVITGWVGFERTSLGNLFALYQLSSRLLVSTTF
ncbi:hypothetical protein Tco_0459480, partial [Tanacetum coccineum]